MAKFLLTPRQKRQLQRQAKAKLGRRVPGHIWNLFNAVAEQMGRAPSFGGGNKNPGYALLAEFVGSAVSPRIVVTKPLVHPAATDAFLQSYEWRRLRMVVLTKRGARCECCGHTAKDGIKIHVDHIKPRRKYPELALVESNLQILCEVCNHGKGNWDETDWRDAPMHGTVQ